MFGWRYVGGCRRDSRQRYGATIECFSSGLWLSVWWGTKSWSFTRYNRANRHTGAESNDAVNVAFYTGPDRRKRDRKFSAGFEAAAMKGPVKDYRRRGYEG
jgi:hypothetical protein